MQNELEKVIKDAFEIAWDNYDLTAELARGVIDSFLTALANNGYTIIKSPLAQLRETLKNTEV